MASQKVENAKQEAGVDSEKLVEVGDAWDEAQLEAGMKMLKEMHIQARNLRSTIPRLLDPLASKHKPSPQAVLAEYQTSINTMNKEAKEFREVMTAEEGKRVLQYANERREKITGPIQPWMATNHPGWSVRDYKP